MTTVNYPTPVLVNGYSCRNCTDVANAKKHIDPQHPKDGPFGVDKPPSQGGQGGATAAGQSPAVVLGGQLAAAARSDPTRPDATRPDAPDPAQGSRLDVKV